MRVFSGPIQNFAVRQPSLEAMAAPRQWFHLKASGEKVVEIYIMDEISRWGESAQSLVQQIRDIKDDARIKLHLFSPGGDVMEGNEIYNALKAHKGGVDVEIGAFCASIATLLACSGERVTMPKNGWYMVHNPWTFAFGEADEFRKMADILDKMKGQLADVYVTKTGKPKDEISKLMSEETWMTAQEAKERGFIDEVVDEEDDEVEMVAARFDLSGFRNCARFLKSTKQFSLQSKPKTQEQEKPKPTTKPSAKIESSGNIVNNYMKNKVRIFAGTIPFILASGIRPFQNLRFDPPADRGGAGSGTITEEEEETRIKAAARKLYEAKMTRDKEIDDIVLAVRNRDKKDFSELAGKFKQQDKTADEFARAITTSDEFQQTGVVGSGDQSIEVLGVQGLPKGTPGEVFVASEEYKYFIDQHRKGGPRKRQSMAVQTQGFLQSIINQIFHNATTTSSGLTSIEKLPGVVTLGVRPLTVKDLLAPGATNNTTIRYIQEVSFTNAATTVAEGAAKPEASFVLNEVDAPVKKVAAWTKVTDELFADYLAVASYINMRLPYMVERTTEDQLLNGDGVGSNLTGILATAGIQTQAKGGDTAADALYKAITKVRWGNLAGTAQGGFEPDGYVLHPTDWEALRLAKDANNQYFGGGPFTGAYGNGSVVQFEMIWGKPVVVTPAIAQGKALCGAFRLCAQYFQRQGLVIESTNTDQDDFIKNLTTIRAEERLALAVYRPLGFCQVTGL